MQTACKSLAQQLNGSRTFTKLSGDSSSPHVRRSSQVSIAHRGENAGNAISHRTAVPPEDFEAALDLDPRAKKFFAPLDSQNRYAIPFRIQTETKNQTRKSKIEEFVAMLEENRKLYP